MLDLLPTGGELFFGSASAAANNPFSIVPPLFDEGGATTRRAQMATSHIYSPYSATIYQPDAVDATRRGHRKYSSNTNSRSHHRHRNIWLLETLNYIISSTLPNRTTFDALSAPPYLNTPSSAVFDKSYSSIENSELTVFHTVTPSLPSSSTLQNSYSTAALHAVSGSELLDSAVLRAIKWRHPLLSIIFIGVCLLTVAGNCLVVLAVCTKKYLRNPTGYLIVSLAVADLIVGMIVMPLNSLFEMTRHVWLLGLPMCDLFHALDILASTSSIWNLCVISLDRYMAGHDPIGYRDRVSKRRIIFAIIFVWVMSSCLSFPAIIWWRQSSPQLYTDKYKCLFTDNSLYVVFSSLVSFYIPLIMILYAYGRVFLIATRHSKSIKSGIKKVQSRRGRNKTTTRNNNCASSASVHNENSTMRIHLGRKSKKISQKSTKCENSALAKVILAASNGNAGGGSGYLCTTQHGALTHTALVSVLPNAKANCATIAQNPNGSAFFKRIAAITANDSIQSECSSDATAETTDRRSPVVDYYGIRRAVTRGAPAAPPPFQTSRSSTALLDTPPRRRSGKSPSASMRGVKKDVAFATDQLSNCGEHPDNSCYNNNNNNNSGCYDKRRLSTTNLQRKSSEYSAHTVVSALSSASATLTGGSHVSTDARSGTNHSNVTFFPSNFDAEAAAASHGIDNSLFCGENSEKASDISPSYNNGRSSDDDSLSYRCSFSTSNHAYANYKNNTNNKSAMRNNSIHANGYPNGSATMPSITVTSNSSAANAQAAAAARKRGGMREKSRQMMKYVHEQRAARTLSIVVGVFIICWTPFFVLSPIMVLCKTCIENKETFFSVITWAGHLNSMLNPLIYSRFSRDFRKAFKQILTCERERTTKKAIRTPLNLMLAQLASIAQIPTPPSTAASPKPHQNPQQPQQSQPVAEVTQTAVEVEQQPDQENKSDEPHTQFEPISTTENSPLTITVPITTTTTDTVPMTTFATVPATMSASIVNNTVPFKESHKKLSTVLFSTPHTITDAIPCTETVISMVPMTEC